MTEPWPIRAEDLPAEVQVQARHKLESGTFSKQVFDVRIVFTVRKNRRQTALEIRAALFNRAGVASVRFELGEDLDLGNLRLAAERLYAQLEWRGYRPFQYRWRSEGKLWTAWIALDELDLTDDQKQKMARGTGRGSGGR